jgi:regulator of extracellular matrix RemA (YlzA/DUF370 family)
MLLNFQVIFIFLRFTNLKSIKKRLQDSKVAQTILDAQFGWKFRVSVIHKYTQNLLSLIDRRQIK